MFRSFQLGDEISLIGRVSNHIGDFALGRYNINLSLALSNLPSMAVRLANLPRRDALKGVAIVLPLSSVAKYTRP